MYRFAKWNLPVLLFLFSTISASAQHSALAAQRGLDVLANRAERIVRGRVVEAHLEPHPELRNLTTLSVTMAVDSVLKGSAGKTLTFRQFVWDVRDRYNKAGYTKGQELLLLLNPVSEYGLTSPSGMEQGRFVITRNADGSVSAVNGISNAGLFKGVSQAATQKGITLSARSRAMVQGVASGPVPLADLEDTIRSLVKGTAVAK
jgi:hypothetical protein